MSVPATVINATAPVRMRVRRLVIGVLGIALDGGRETVDLAGPFSLDDMSHPSIMEEVVVTLSMLNRYCRDLRKTFAKFTEICIEVTLLQA
jgi:hypothetical protein